MGMPRGEILDRPMLARACGCVQRGVARMVGDNHRTRARVVIGILAGMFGIAVGAATAAYCAWLLFGPVVLRFWVSGWWIASGDRYVMVRCGMLIGAAIGGGTALAIWRMRGACRT